MKTTAQSLSQYVYIAFLFVIMIISASNLLDRNIHVIITGVLSVLFMGIILYNNMYEHSSLVLRTLPLVIGAIIYIHDFIYSSNDPRMANFIKEFGPTTRYIIPAVYVGLLYVIASVAIKIVNIKIKKREVDSKILTVA